VKIGRPIEEHKKIKEKEVTNQVQLQLIRISLKTKSTSLSNKKTPIRTSRTKPVKGLSSR